jgi:hypothetical protein
VWPIMDCTAFTYWARMGGPLGGLPWPIPLWWFIEHENRAALHALLADNGVWCDTVTADVVPLGEGLGGG